MTKTLTAKFGRKLPVETCDIVRVEDGCYYVVRRPNGDEVRMRFDDSRIKRCATLRVATD